MTRTSRLAQRGAAVEEKLSRDQWFDRLKYSDRASVEFEIIGTQAVTAARKH